MTLHEAKAPGGRPPYWISHDNARKCHCCEKRCIYHVRAHVKSNDTLLVVLLCGVLLWLLAWAYVCVHECESANACVWLRKCMCVCECVHACLCDSSSCCRVLWWALLLGQSCTHHETEASKQIDTVKKDDMLLALPHRHPAWAPSMNSPPVPPSAWNLYEYQMDDCVTVGRPVG